LLESFRQWCEQARVDFELEAGLEAQLQQRPFMIGRVQTYRFWRSLQKDSPIRAKAAGFQDDPTRGDDEEVLVAAEAIPAWTPGACMKGPIPGRTRILRRVCQPAVRPDVKSTGEATAT
jgi:hypothetical protein